MASESLQAQSPSEKGEGSCPLSPTPALAPTARLQHRYRLRFQKTENLRLVSHIDLMHVFERLMRRADLPFATTQGFHPKPNLVFAQALALGVAGLNEVVDLELREPLPAEDILQRLNRHAPVGLVFLDAKTLSRKGSLAVRRAFYRLPLSAPVADLPQRCQALLARPRCVVQRLHPQRRLVDIRPYFCELGAEGAALTMALWVTPDGAARPEEVVRSLGLGELLEAGAVLERTRLELMEDLPEAERWLPQIPKMNDVAIDPSEVVLAAAETPRQQAAADESLIESPMSYET